MKNTKWISASVVLLASNNVALTQTKKPSSAVLAAQTTIPAAQERADKNAADLDAQREKHALQVFLKLGQTLIVSAADAMPADKYGFAPTDGEFKGVSWLLPRWARNPRPERGTRWGRKPYGPRRRFSTT
jgi:hypothetical protein